MFRFPFQPKSRWPQPLLPRKKCAIVFITALSDGAISGMEDLLDSFRCYLDCDYEVLIANDCTTDGSAEKLYQQRQWIINNPQKMGFKGNSYTFRRTLKYAVELFDAPFYIEIDPDALAIAPGLVEKLSEFCPKHPQAGLFGNYLYTPTGEKRDFSYWQEIMHKNKKLLNPPLKLALENGYELGSGIQGGAYCITQPCLTKINQLGFLHNWDPWDSISTARNWPDDHIFTMLAYAAGFTAIDFGSSNEPFASRHKELAMTPEELINDGRILIHPIKYHDEKSLSYREFFKRHRKTYQAMKDKS